MPHVSTSLKARNSKTSQAHHRPAPPATGLSAGLRAVLLTRHGKATAIAPALTKAGFALETYDGFDTDRLGSFTGEIARAGDQFEAALAKAKLATSLTGSRYGLGSEGSFGPDPYLGMMPWNQEVLVWWDAERSYAVSAIVANGDTNHAQASVDSLEAAQAFAARIGFPTHGLVIGKPGDAVFAKGITTTDALERAVREALDASGSTCLASDLRAHLNPRRMDNIRLVAQALAARLASSCTVCRAPGFGAHRQLPGALCEDCGLPTRAARAELLLCPACGHTEQRTLCAHTSAQNCAVCNP